MDSEMKMMYVYVVIDHWMQNICSFRRYCLVKVECPTNTSDEDIISRASTKAMLALGFYNNPGYTINKYHTRILCNEDSLNIIE